MADGGKKGGTSVDACEQGRAAVTWVGIFFLRIGRDRLYLRAN